MRGHTLFPHEILIQENGKLESKNTRIHTRSNIYYYRSVERSRRNIKEAPAGIMRRCGCWVRKQMRREYFLLRSKTVLDHREQERRICGAENEAYLGGTYKPACSTAGGRRRGVLACVFRPPVRDLLGVLWAWACRWSCRDRLSPCIAYWCASFRTKV